MNFSSFIPVEHKFGLVYTLLHRCFCLVSDMPKFHFEIEKLKEILLSNGYSDKLINKCISKFMNNLYFMKFIMLTVPKKHPYLALPSLDNYRNVYLFVRLKLFSRPLIVSEITLALQILFLSMYVIVKFIILRAQPAVLHVKVRPLRSTRKSGSRNTKAYHLKQVKICKELCQSPSEIIYLIATTQYNDTTLKY